LLVHAATNAKLTTAATDRRRIIGADNKELESRVK
jgi:hypothetical protein